MTGCFIKNDKVTVDISHHYKWRKLHSTFCGLQSVYIQQENHKTKKKHYQASTFAQIYFDMNREEADKLFLFGSDKYLCLIKIMNWWGGVAFNFFVLQSIPNVMNSDNYFSLISCYRSIIFKYISLFLLPL